MIAISVVYVHVNLGVISTLASVHFIRIVVFVCSLQYLKLEEVNEQCRLYQWQIDYRGSLLAVMLHHTVDHETEEDTNREKQTTDCMDIGGVEN